MKSIMVSGVKETEKDSLIEICVKRSGLKIYLLSFKQLIPKKFKPFDIKTLEEAEEFKRVLKKHIEIAVCRYAKENKPLVVNGFFTVKTRLGSIPVLSESFFHLFKPSLFLILEIDPSEFPKDLAKKIEEEQAINREQAELFSTCIGCPFKIIRVEKNNIKETLDKIIDTFRMVFGG